MNIEQNSQNSFEEFLFEKADYKQQRNSDYDGIPMIEALPPILETEEDIMDLFYSIPTIEDDERLLPPLIKAHILRRVKRFFQPLPIHIGLESSISILIRQSYLSRNPFSNEYKRKMQLLHSLKGKDGVTIKDIKNTYKDFLHSTADCIFINGVSGMGKTTAINCILKQYPRVIKHHEYKGQKFTKTQITWLKIDCPPDGSFTTLCRSIFKQIDDLTQERWNEKYGYLTRSISLMLMHLSGLLATYNVGVLVIDEIQNLYNGPDDPKEMLDFFVTLTNVLSVPIIFIGTNKAKKLFQKNFRLARRVQSEGIIEISNLKEESEPWQLFLETLLEFNILENTTQQSDEFKKEFHNQSQGIPAIAVMLFIFAQTRAMANKQTTLTPTILRQVADNDLKLLQPMLTALRSGNPKLIAQFDDIHIDDSAIFEEYERDIKMQEQIQEKIEQKKEEIMSKRSNVREQLFIEFASSGLFNHIKPEIIQKIIDGVVNKSNVNTDYEDLKDVIMETLQDEKKKFRKPRNENIIPLEKGSLLALYDKAIDKKQHPYEILLKQGFIKNPIDEFLMAK